MVAGRVPGRNLLWFVLGFGIWCSALIILYALHSVGCAFGWASATLRLSLALVLLAHLALIGIAWRRCAMGAPDLALGETASFMHWVSLWTLIAAFVTTVFTLAPALLLTTCT